VHCGDPQTARNLFGCSGPHNGHRIGGVFGGPITDMPGTIITDQNMCGAQ
jgi:hypothetical protein